MPHGGSLTLGPNTFGEPDLSPSHGYHLPSTGLPPEFTNTSLGKGGSKARSGVRNPAACLPEGALPSASGHGRTGETQGEAQPLHPSFPRAADAIYSWAAVTATQAQRH